MEEMDEMELDEHTSGLRAKQLGTRLREEGKSNEQVAKILKMLWMSNHKTSLRISSARLT